MTVVIPFSGFPMDSDAPASSTGLRRTVRGCSTWASSVTRLSGETTLTAPTRAELIFRLS